MTLYKQNCSLTQIRTSKAQLACAFTQSDHSLSSLRTLAIFINPRDNAQAKLHKPVSITLRCSQNETGHLQNSRSTFQWENDNLYP